MRICFASALDLIEEGKSLDGLPQRRTIEFYLKQGDYVTFITGNKETEKSINDSIHHYENYKEIRFAIRYIDSFSKLRKLGWFANSIKWFFYQILFILHLNKCKIQTYDVLYAYEIHSVPAMWLMSKIYSIPLITRFQGTIVPSDCGLLTKLKLWQHIIALCINSELTIMTDDGTGGDRVINNLRRRKSNIVFLVNGIDGIFYDVPSIGNLDAKDELRIYCCSRLVEWKNNDRNIRVIYEVIKKCSNVHLYIIGGGPLKDALCEMVNDLGLEESIDFLGVLSHEEMVRCISNSQIYLTNYSYSNFGKTMMEAMASGRLIVASNVGDTSRYIKDGESGYLVEDGDIKSIVDKIVYIYFNRAALALGENGRKTAKNLFSSWEARFNRERLEIIKIQRPRS